MEILNIDFECSTCNKVNQAAKRIPVQRVIEKLDAFFDKNDLEGAKRLLEYWKTEAETTGDLTGELSIVNEMLGLYRKISDKEKGLAAVERAIELLALTSKENTMSGATILINAATTSKAFGNPEKAVPLYDKAEEIYKKNGLSQDDTEYAALYNNYATTLAELKKFKKAEVLYKKAIELTGKDKNTQLDCAISYVNLAHLYDQWHGSIYEKNDECMKQAETLLKDESVKRDSYYAFVSEKCAPSFDYFGYFAFAEELREKAREIYERA